MLESVMLKGGTGTKAAIAGYRIAGKTGTAQQPDPATGQYSATAFWDTYDGIAPADNPNFVVGIMIDNPAHGLHGGDVAAPLFREIAAYELQHEGIAPVGLGVQVRSPADSVRRGSNRLSCGSVPQSEIGEFPAPSPAHSSRPAGRAGRIDPAGADRDLGRRHRSVGQ